jgi:tetratricopeptide (TPR) repeat protein
MMQTLLLGLLFILSPALAQPDSTESDQQARVLYQNGTELFDEGRYVDAIAAWEMAYVLSPRPLLLVNMASAFERLGDNVAALDKLYRYKAYAPVAERPTIERRIRSLEARMDEDQAIEEIRQVEEAEEEEEQRVVAAVDEREPVRRGPEPKPAWSMGSGPVALYALAGAGAISGTVFALRAESARQEAAGLCSTGDAVFCPGSAVGVLAKDNTSSLVADISFSVAGAALVGGTIWMFASNSRGTGVQLVPVRNGLGLQGAF